ncbi:uncharacterized protein LOC108092827 [Drosophila ficusphila]|uniref:uncharacterized protein LOC108092827 n=1 Tax=Drosophila ficusphila TaxID=30025 RepID=UPI0007E6E01C|nr:uncharacterized protein LOC108092827 [Drosophila ficusphila]
MMLAFLDESANEYQVANMAASPVGRRRLTQRPQLPEVIYVQGIPYINGRRFPVPWQPQAERPTRVGTDEVPTVPERNEVQANATILRLRRTRRTVPLVAERRCMWRRCAHTLPPLGEVDEHETQPLLHLALEALKTENEKEKEKRNSDSVGSLGHSVDPIVNPSQFVAEYLANYMTFEVLQAGNRPRYGPSQENGTRMHSPRNT